MVSRISWGLAGCLLVVALSASVTAQEGQKGRGRGFGFFGRGNSVVSLAGNEAVQKEIGADAATASKLETIADEYRTALGEEMRSAAGGNLQNLSDDERRAAFTKMRETAAKVTAKFEPKVKEAVTAEQFKRLQEISVRAAGSDAFTDARVSKELALTEEQTKKITDIRTEYERKQGDLGRDADREARSKLREEELKAATAVLTKEQQDKFTALQGKEFDTSVLRQGRGGDRGDGKRPEGARPRTKRPATE